MKSQTNKKPSWYQLFQKPVLFIGVLLLLLGIYSYLNTTKGLFPEVEFPRITLIANAGQQPVDRMMITVTKPLESAVKKVPGVTLVKSVTSRGSTQIDVFFQWGGDIYGKKAQLESRVNEIKNFLPQGTVISTEVMNQSLYPVYGFTLKSKTHSQIEMRDVANLIVRPLFSQVAMTGGLQIGSIQDGEQMRRILLRFTNYADNDPQKIMRQPIFLPDGTTRPVSFFAQWEVIPGEIEQKRENLKSDITLTARLDQRDLGTTVADLQKAFNSELKLPQGYSIQFGGAYSEQQQSFQELAMILCLAALLVFTVLLFLIRKWGMSLAILLIAVCGLCGSLIALAITHTPLNVSSYTGMIMVVGIIAENAIFTLNQYDMNRKAGGSVSESVDYAIALRIRPKLMTAISAILALMPLALGFGLGAQMQQPLAIAVIGGFCVALPLLLVVLPTMMLKIMKCDE